MTDVIEQSEAVELPAAGGPGKHLREARESRKLTPGQVAGQLRLQTRIIEALESDDYSSLAGSTFVQGYLRSYSRLLGLSENNIVALAQLSNVAEPSLVSSIYEGDSEVSSRDLPFRMVTFLILLVAVVGLGWWLSQHQPLPANVTPQIEQTGGGEQGLLLPDEAVPQQDVLLAGEGEAAGDAATETASTAEPGDSVEEVEPEVPVVTAPPVTTRPQAAVPVAPPALTAEMPQSLLELEYQADSWSEISDAAGRKLAYGLVPAGKRLELRGEAPFRVFLGFASGVTVYYNGVLYDHTSFQSGDMARFRLGRAEHNRPASR